MFYNLILTQFSTIIWTSLHAFVVDGRCFIDFFSLLDFLAFSGAVPGRDGRNVSSLIVIPAYELSKMLPARWSDS